MITRIYQIYASFTAGSNATAYVDILKDGYIVGIYGSLAVDNVAAAVCIAEISQQGILLSGANNAIGPLMTVQTYGAAGAKTFANATTPPMAIPVKTGNRIYLNTGGNAANNAVMIAQLHVSE